MVFFNRRARSSSYYLFNDRLTICFTLIFMVILPLATISTTNIWSNDRSFNEKFALKLEMIMVYKNNQRSTTDPFANYIWYNRSFYEQVWIIVFCDKFLIHLQILHWQIMGPTTHPLTSMVGSNDTSNSVRLQAACGKDMSICSIELKCTRNKKWSSFMVLFLIFVPDPQVTICSTTD